MPSPAFIAAASAANRQPVVLLAVESIDAIKRAITTQPDWQASTCSNVNTAYEPGRVFLGTDDVEPYAGDYSTGVVLSGVTSPPAEHLRDGEGGWYDKATGPVFFSGTNVTSISVTVSGYHGVDTPPFPAATWYLYGRESGGAWILLDSAPVYTYTSTLVFEASVAKGNWEFHLEARAVLTGMLSITAVSYEATHQVRFLTSGSVITPSVDLGVSPTIPSRFEADDIVPAGGSLAYQIWGSDDNSTWIDLGTVTDGEQVAPYRYYRFRADFTGNGLYSPYIDELRIVGGDAQYDYFSTHQDIPIQGARPYIAPSGLSSLSSKIDLLDQATVGELTIKLHWRRDVGDMIHSGYLKNKNLICKIGFLGLAEQDYEPYFTGTWHDYQADGDKQLITIKTRNVLKKFNRKVPDVGFFVDLKGQTYNPPRVYTISTNIMSAMLEIADLSGVPDRFLDRAAFLALGAGARSGSDWAVTRTLKEPEDAAELLHQLAVSAGVFLVELPDGRLTVKLYDQFLTDPPAATFDAKLHAFKIVEGGQKDLFTRQAIYYQLQSGKDGGSASDYGQCHRRINEESELNWNESATREWMDRWGLSPTAIQMLAQRWDSWFANPRNTVKVDKVPPRFWNVERGQVVAVDNLRLPCPADQWEGYTDAARYLVMGKTISDPTGTDLSFSYDLLALADAAFVPDPKFPTYSPLEFWPKVTGLALSERLALVPGGSVQTVLDVSFVQPADFHFGSAQIWTRENGGEWRFQIPVGYGGPSLQRLATITVTDGTTVDVAVLTVNAAGLVMPIDDAPKATAVIVGKTAPPADISGVSLSFQRGFAYFTWDQVPDLDVQYSGAIVIKHSGASSSATWSGANEVGRFSGASTTAVLPAASGTYLIKAEDSSGNQSVNAYVVVSDVPALLNLNEVAVLTESPTFGGAKTRCSVADGELVLDTTTLLDGCLGTWDSLPGLFDDLPGTQTGSYEFSAPLVLGQVSSCMITATLISEAVATNATFDERVGHMDGWSGTFDGGNGTSGNARLMISVSQDGSNWSPFVPFIPSWYKGKAFKFRLDLTSFDPNYTVSVSEVSVKIDMEDLLQSGAATVTADGIHVTFPRAFYSPQPHLSFTIYDAVAGDFASPSNVTATGFDVVIKDFSNIPVQRDINWFAKGY